VFAAVGALGCELSLFLILAFLVVNDWSVDTGTMTYMPLVSLSARMQGYDKVMEHFPF